MLLNLRETDCESNEWKARNTSPDSVEARTERRRTHKRKECEESTRGEIKGKKLPLEMEMVTA